MAVSHHLLSRRALGILAMVAVLLSGGGAPAGEDRGLVKAAYIYNFARFTEWPESSFAGPGDRLRVCFRHGDPLSGALASINGKTVGAREIQIVAIDPAIQAPPACHIAVISPADPSGAALVSRGLLTVADIGGIGQAGVAVGLVQVGHQVRFQVDAALVQRADLRMSSKLLRLAVRVDQ